MSSYRLGAWQGIMSSDRDVDLHRRISTERSEMIVAEELSYGNREQTVLTCVLKVSTLERG
jgi:hypothetical protein